MSPPPNIYLRVLASVSLLFSVTTTETERRPNPRNALEQEENDDWSREANEET